MSQAHGYNNTTAEPSTPCSLYIVLPWWRHDAHCGFAYAISCIVACQTVVYLAWPLHLSVICTKQLQMEQWQHRQASNNLPVQPTDESYTTLIQPNLLAGSVHACRANKLKQDLTIMQALHQGSCYPCRI